MKKTSPIDKMDSLKIPKGGSAGTGGTKPTGSVPITVRFNAGDECIDDIFQSFHNSSSNSVGSSGGGGGGGGGGSGDSLSTSPSQQPQQHQQNADEVNTRNNFLQGNFFNRKRSGSCEGTSPTSLGPNLIAALATGGDTNSVGTWKLIKGKVSQTIEDIKASKSSNQTITISKGETPHEHDSDWETATIHSSISDELSLDLESKQIEKIDSDSDNEYELIYEAGSGDSENARLRRSVHKPKIKIKSSSLQQTHRQSKQKPHSLSSSPSNPTMLSSSTMAASSKNVKKDTSPSRSEGITTGSTRSSFLRRLKKTSPSTGTLEPPTQETDSSAHTKSSGTSAKRGRKYGIESGRKETHEIESGVEMLEDMMMPGVSESTGKTDNETNTSSDKTQTQNDGNSLMCAKQQINANLVENQALFNNLKNMWTHSLTLVESLMHHIPFFTIFGLGIVMLLPMPEFLRGVLACLLVTALLESTWTSLLRLFETYILKTVPERAQFKIPDYEVKSIFEVPAAEETKPTKTYVGWMNEVNSYDPANFHISMAESVFIKLDGTILRVSNTTARIPKRVTWNEPPIDRKSLTFTQHRTYDLLGCRLELLPVGLASKRFFNRKYPIQLIIKNQYDTKTGFKCSNPDIPLSTGSSRENIKTCDKKPTTDVENVLDTTVEHSTSQVSLQGSTSDVRSERSRELKQDFAATIMNADLQTLQDTKNSDAEIKDISVPCGDETRLLLFARADREKEDWFRRFQAASTGAVNDDNLRLPNLRFVTEIDLQEAAVKAALLITNPAPVNEPPTATTTTTTIAFNENNSTNETPDREVEVDNVKDSEQEPEVEENFEGLVMSSSAGRNPKDYIKFMSLYQKSCNQTTIPVFRQPIEVKEKENLKKAARREKRNEENLWKGIDQSLFLGPSGSVVWFNVILGRFFYSILSSCTLQKKIQEYFQKKLHTVKLPSFMEEVIITEIDMGETPPLIHRVSQAMLDERGTWVDADVTYEGLLNFTVTTKLNLMRLKKPTKKPETTHLTVHAPGTGILPADDSENSMISFGIAHMGLAKSAIYDSDAESTGSSSSESEESDLTSYTSLPISTGDTEDNKNTEANLTQQQTKKKPNKIFKIVDRFAASNFFQYATELPYVQRAMENMNANITLRLEVKGMVSRVTINLPPPPSDRVWFGFRGPPRLWIQAKPAFGDKTVDWSFLTSVIESKICEQINKILVYPNMVDITIAFLGKSPFPEPEKTDGI